MKLIILITSNVENGLDVAVRWQEAGAPGVTVLKSFGLYSLQRKMMGDSLEVPLHIASSMSSMMAYVLREMELNNHVCCRSCRKNWCRRCWMKRAPSWATCWSPTTASPFVVPLDEAIGVRQPENGDG